MDPVKQIIKATKIGDLEAVADLLTADPQLVSSVDRDGSTPLHCAAWKGHVQVATLLLDSDADMNAHNDNAHWGTTALHAASHGNNKAVVELSI
jgi:ankyrin repeat protein